MPQNTNLNVSPYNDDFNEDKNYQRVLFKPGTAIQARELTTLQTILQNQIERFGSYMFKEGSKVIPGQTGYDENYEFIQVDSSFFGIGVETYLDQLVGKEIQGETSGVTALVVKAITAAESERGNITLYIRYIRASNQDFITSKFVDGERLLVLSDLEYGLSIIKENSPFATAVSENATGTGSAAFIEEGIYFIRGFFVKVQSSTILLDQYTNTPSYRIGLLVSEEIVTSFDDSDLNDNSQGFSNFSAPGADRFKISTTFIKKPIDEFNDENFIELMRVQDGLLLKFVDNSELNFLGDELARRTYDESGDYYIKPFEVFIKESLNNFDFNGGIYKENEITAQGNIPSEDLYTLQISPGKAYVKGYEIEKISSTFLDVRKPETSKDVPTYSLPFRAGNKFFVNNVTGSPSVGFGTTAVLSLKNRRVGSEPLEQVGTEIGKARCYDFKVKDAAYADDTTDFEMFLYDIDTFTQVTIGSSITLAGPAQIKGNSSGSVGYLHNTVNDGKILTLNSVDGSFIVGESISVNGISSAPTISSITDFSLSDVKSVYGHVGVNTFTADLGLTGTFKLEDAALTISPASTSDAGISTITGPITSRFADGLKVNDIVSYVRPGFTTETFNRITSISSSLDSVTVTGVTTVSGICDGQVPYTETTSVVRLRTPELSDNQFSAFYEPLADVNISNVNLDNSQVVYRKTFAAEVSSNGCVIIEQDVDSVFEPFDEERYILSYSDGAIEPLKAGQFSISANGRTLTLTQLSQATDDDATLIATLRKIKVDSKSKVLNRCATLTINKSNDFASGTTANTSLNDGLTYSSVYGLRVQDKEISLNKAEVLRIHGVFESDDSNDPTLPSLTLNNIDGSLVEAAVGDQITGNTSFAIGRIVSVTSDTITFVYNNDREFQLGESVTLKLSQITGTITSIELGDKLIDASFILDSGERLEYLDFGRIIRNDSAPIPSRRLTIVYDYYDTPTSDTGEFFSYLSWPPRVVHDGIDLPRIDYQALRHSDVIDFRPRVSDYTDETYSPFQYESRVFPNNGSSVTTTPVSGESLVIGYSYRLPRADKLILTKGGDFKVISGEPADDPVPPIITDGSFEVGTFTLRPYSYLARHDIQFNRTKHKRYQMKDIGKLEDRIQSIEYYTQLTLLETEASNLSIKDPLTGLDRFKNGIFVDNFRRHESHNMSNPDFKASIDAASGIMRPSHYTTSIDLLVGSASAIGIGTTANTSTDLRFVTDLQNPNIQKTGDLITLKYEEEVFIEQKFATRSVNVNPFAVLSWFGTMELNPSTDTWIEEKMLDPVTVEQQGNYDAFMSSFQVDPNTGLSPVDWGAWEEVWSGRTVTGETRIKKGKVPKSTELVSTRIVPGGPHARSRRVRTFRDTFVDTYLQEVEVETRSSREGIQRRITERIDTVSVGSKVVSRELIPYCRERNIEFVAKRIKPLTQMYVFFENVNMTEYVVPKLIEIEMDSGVFEVGETVESAIPTISNPSVEAEQIRFRVAAPDHKYGPYNNPSLRFKTNPFSEGNVGLSSSYATTSTILNVDTASLSNIQQNFKGRIKVGTKLIGNTSGAEATITNVRLVSDTAGTVIGSLYIPNPKHTTNPQFQSGTRTIRVTASPINATATGSVESAAEGKFTSAGTIDNKQETFIATRNADVEIVTVTDTKLETSQQLQTATRDRTEIRRWVDPLAESFEIAEGDECFISSIDVFFKTKDKDIPVTCQIRTMQTGLPTSIILPFAETSLEPDQVNISEDGSVATNFKFKSPVFLQGGTSYAIVLISLSNNYEAWISRMGEVDISTADLNENEQVIVSQQPYMGSLFKSQNGSTWDASQLEDLKFTINRCKFVTEPGVFVSYNPALSEANDKIVNLRPNPIFTPSKEVVIGLGSAISTTDLNSGVTITQLNNLSATGKLVRSTGAIGIGSTTSGDYNLTVNNVGSGITPSTGTFYYGNVALTAVTGGGSGGVAQVEVIGGTVGIITVTDGGRGYAVGDVVSVKLGATSENVRFNVGIITATNQLVLNQVQGEFDTVNEMAYNAVGVASTVPSVPTTVNVIDNGDGQHMVVSHRNHGMHATNNKVEISNVQGDNPTTKLSASYAKNSTEDITLDSISIFTEFENVGVSSTNPGYIKVNNEIISYETTNGNTLVGITRGIDDSVIRSHPVGSAVAKYEFNGVSLRRINGVHELSSSTRTNPITIDTYSIKVGMSTNGVDRSVGNSGGFQPLAFNSTKLGGGSIVRATQNIQFEAVTPNVSTLIPTGTELTARIRTVSGTSASGTELSFQDQGFEPVQLGEVNYFTTPRIVASQINETARLNALPGNKSLTMEFLMQTDTERLSPVIDLQRLNLITTTNRIDDPVDDYASDARVNLSIGDPHSASYVSKKVRLATPATSLQVRFAGYRHPTNEIRVLYKLFRSDLPDSSQPYLLFPGYNNLTRNGTNDEKEYVVVDPAKNNGLPNDFVQASSFRGQYYDFLYSQDNLPPFTGFMIKIVMSGTNQAYVPEIRELTAIALA